MKNQAIIEHIEKLTVYLKERSTYDVFVPERDGACLSVDFNTGNCELTSWMESYHNGDPYNTKTKKLTPDEALPFLARVERDLWAKAEAKVVEVARKEREKREREELRAATKAAVFGKWETGED